MTVTLSRSRSLPLSLSASSFSSQNAVPVCVTVKASSPLVADDGVDVHVSSIAHPGGVGVGVGFC